MIHSAMVIEGVLRKLVPEASDDVVYHQLEYLRAILYDDGYLLEGPGWKEKPVFLHNFYGKDKELIPEIQAALDIYYNESVAKLTSRVTNAIAAMETPATTLWLTKRKDYPIKDGVFMGLRVMFHNCKEEFVAALEHGRVALLNK